LIESLDDLEPAALPMPTRCGVGTGRHARARDLLKRDRSSRLGRGDEVRKLLARVSRVGNGGWPGLSKHSSAGPSTAARRWTFICGQRSASAIAWARSTTRRSIGSATSISSAASARN